jgi:hypothetical protein
VRIVSTPKNPRDGAKLAEEVLAGVRETNGAHTEPNGGGPADANRGGGRA